MDSRRLALTMTVALLGSLCVVLSLLTSTARAAVPDNLTVCPAGPPDCDYAIIQDAVDAARDGDVIKIAAGVYTDVHIRPRRDVKTTGVVTQVVYISKTVTIRGGYIAPDFSDPPDPEVNQSILDAENQGRVLYITGYIDPAIEGLYITGGNADGMEGYIEPWSWQDHGGGIYAITATVTLRSSHVYSNTADFSGGLYFYHCNGSVLVDNVITGNSARQLGKGSGGGGSLVQCSDLILSGNSIRANVASGIGAGLLLLRSSARLSGNSLVGNNAEVAGGGLHLSICSVQIDGSVVASNVADLGGGVYMSSSDVALNNNIISENTGRLAGGGLYFQGTEGRFKHNTIVRNKGLGGALHVVNGPKPPSFSFVSLTNTILLSQTVAITVAKGNTARLEATLWGTGTWANEIDWGGVGTITTGTRNLWADPDFVAPETGDYHIGTASAAVNRGVNVGIGDDIDGDLRPDGCFFDIGADEYITGAPCFRMYLPLIFKDR